MLTRSDLVDLIMERLKSASSIPQPSPGEGGPRGRIFLSEYDIKKQLTSGVSHLTIPRDAILSPLASDWLVLKGIKVVRE